MAQHLVTQVSQDGADSNDSESFICCCPFFYCCCCCPKPSPNIPNPIGDNPVHNPSKNLLPDIPKGQSRKKCLVLDLDETLVHSSFKPIPDADFKIEIELENTIHRVYVRKRPYVDEFLKHVGKKWEVVIFTASLAKYADPLLDILDRDNVVSTRLFREACIQHYGNYVKDLSRMGRPLNEIVIIDNSPFSYMFQQDNAIPITSWFNDRNDQQLHDLMPFLDNLLETDDIIKVLKRKNFPFLEPAEELSTEDDN